MKPIDAGQSGSGGDPGAKFTPGPWEWRDSNELRTLHDRGEYPYGSLVTCIRDWDAGDSMISEPDMNLIAAAPELYAALVGLLALAEKKFNMLQETAKRGLTSMKPPGVQFDDLRFVQRSKAALAKARGESAPPPLPEATAAQAPAGVDGGAGEKLGKSLACPNCDPWTTGKHTADCRAMREF